MDTVNSNTYIGQRFSRWIVLSDSYLLKRHRVVQCRCDCGKVREIKVLSIVRGGSKSCGCIGIESRTVHGKSKYTSEYAIWNMMRQRTGNKNNKRYADYGGRGISVCERWQNFENFYSDMGPRPSANHSIDRINNSGNYEPSNCRWATRNEQALNTRRNRLLTVNGKSMCIAEWSRETGISQKMITARLGRGWSEEKAVSTKPLPPDYSARIMLANRTARKALVDID